MSDFGSLGVLLHNYGYIGLAVCLALNCMGVPIASEVLLPLCGVLIKRGELDPTLTAVVAFLAQMVGLSASYMLARRGGMKVLERYGRYVFLKRRHLEWMQRLFKKHGDGLILIGTMLPGVHGDVGYPSGLARMGFGRFLILSSAATVVWTAGFMGLGWLLADRLDLLGTVAHGVGGVVFVAMLLVVAAIWYSKHHAHGRT